MSKGEPKIFSIMDGDGTIKRLVEAQTEKEVRAYLLKNIQIGKPSALTVFKLMKNGMRVESAV